MVLVRPSQTKSIMANGLWNGLDEFVGRRAGREDEAILYLPVCGRRAILDATGRVDWAKCGHEGSRSGYGGDMAGNRSKRAKLTRAGLELG
jgi:hypothetical protein